jgi:hypothetical protein
MERWRGDERRGEDAEWAVGVVAVAVKREKPPRNAIQQTPTRILHMWMKAQLEGL